jgi:hypothetical protein
MAPSSDVASVRYHLSLSLRCKSREDSVDAGDDDVILHSLSARHARISGGPGGIRTCHGGRFMAFMANKCGVCEMLPPAHVRHQIDGRMRLAVLCNRTANATYGVTRDGVARDRLPLAGE